MYSVVCFSKRKDYFPLSLPDSSLSGITIHNPHLMTYEKWERQSHAANPFSHLVAEKWVGSVQGSQRPWRDKEMSKKGEKKRERFKKRVEDWGRECKREVMSKSHQQIFYFWSSVERDLPPHWSDLFAAPYEWQRKSVLEEICVVLSSTTEKSKSPNLITEMNYMVYMDCSILLFWMAF